MKTVFRLTLWFIGILLMPQLQATTTQGALVLGAERMDVVTRLLKDKQVGLVVTRHLSWKNSRNTYWML